MLSTKMCRKIKEGHNNCKTYKQIKIRKDEGQVFADIKNLNKCCQSERNSERAKDFLPMYRPDNILFFLIVLKII